MFPTPPRRVSKDPAGLAAVPRWHQAGKSRTPRGIMEVPYRSAAKRASSKRAPAWRGCARGGRTSPAWRLGAPEKPGFQGVAPEREDARRAARDAKVERLFRPITDAREPNRRGCVWPRWEAASPPEYKARSRKRQSGLQQPCEKTRLCGRSSASQDGAVARRRDLHEFPARIQRQQTRLVDVEPGAVKAKLPRSLQRRQSGMGAQIVEALPDRFPRQPFHVIGGVSGPVAEAARRRADQADPVAERVVGTRASPQSAPIRPRHRRGRRRTCHGRARRCISPAMR